LKLNILFWYFVEILIPRVFYVPGYTNFSEVGNEGFQFSQIFSHLLFIFYLFKTLIQFILSFG